MKTSATISTPKTPPRWFVHTAWRVHRALHRLTGGGFLVVLEAASPGSAG